MPTVHEIENALYELAPRELAQSWDNVGLLVGSPGQEVRRVLIALDITGAVADEAAQLGAELIVAHHPVMNCHWHPVQTLRDDTTQGRTLFRLIQGGIAAICMHTNLDAAQGGVSDALAAAIGLEGVSWVEVNGSERVGSLTRAMALPDFLAQVQEGLGCDAFVTADVKYDQFLDAKALDLSLIDAGHFPTENVVCPVLIRYLREHFPGLEVCKSEAHQEVVQYFPAM